MFMTKKSLLMKQLLLQIAALHEVLSIEDFFFVSFIGEIHLHCVSLA